MYLIKKYKHGVALLLALLSLKSTRKLTGIEVVAMAV